jgi:hypothetical protein
MLDQRGTNATRLQAEPNRNCLISQRILLLMIPLSFLSENFQNFNINIFQLIDVEATFTCLMLAQLFKSHSMLLNISGNVQR